MSNNSRDRWSGPLVLAQVTPPGIEIDYRTIQQTGLYIFPQGIGLYPLRRFEQIELYFGLWLYPTNATFLDLQFVGWRAPLNDPTGVAAPQIGALALGQVRFEVYGEDWDEPDPVNDLLIPHRARYRFLPGDVAPSFTPSFPPLGPTYRLGKRLSFPIKDDYAGFLIQHDGLDNSGQMTLFAYLGV